MNDQATAYLAQHGIWVKANGSEELMVPLEKLQGFLDLLQPGDVPPEMLQKLYQYQAQAVQEIKKQLTQPGADPK
jgi:hypothetical protein